MGFAVVVCGAVLAATPAAAQTPLAQVIPTLIRDGLRIAPGVGGTHAEDFLIPADPSDVGAFGSRRPETFNEFVVEQLRTFPIATSSGGFLYSFDPRLGTFARTTRSFGPLYTERPLTSGRGTLSIGASAQRLEFDRISGVPLDSDDVRLYYRHRDRYNGLVLTPERSDVIEARIRLNISSKTLLTMATYGLTDRLDVGLIVPMVETTLEAQVDSTILRFGTTSQPTIHSFDGRGGATASGSGGGTRSGLGDLRLIAKYNMVRRRSLAVAAAFDVRLPTGDADNLLGAGRVFTRGSAIVSAGSRSFSPHAAVTATLVPSRGVENGFHQEGAELTYTSGVDWSIVPRATINADVLVRSSFGDYGFQQDMRPQDLRFDFVTTPTAATRSTTLRGFEYTDAGPPLMHAAFGAKIAAWRTALVMGSVIVPLSDARLRNKPAISIGIEYTF